MIGNTFKTLNPTQKIQVLDYMSGERKLDLGDSNPAGIISIPNLGSLFDTFQAIFPWVSVTSWYVGWGEEGDHLFTGQLCEDDDIHITLAFEDMKPEGRAFLWRRVPLPITDNFQKKRKYKAQILDTHAISSMYLSDTIGWSSKARNKFDEVYP